MRPAVLLSSLAAGILALAARPASAPACSEPCRYSSAELSVDRGIVEPPPDLPCLEIEVGSCYSPVEGRLFNGCEEPLALVDWDVTCELEDCPTELAPGSQLRFLDSPAGGSGPYEERFQVAAGDEIHEFTIALEILYHPPEAFRCPGEGRFAGCAAGGVSSGGGAAEVLGAMALGLFWLRRRPRGAGRRSA
jgi:MYXO-CTERM domain-containing protein